MKFSCSSSFITFTTLCGFWLSQPGHSKPSFSAPCLSNYSYSSPSNRYMRRPPIFNLILHSIFYMLVYIIWFYHNARYKYMEWICSQRLCGCSTVSGMGSDKDKCVTEVVYVCCLVVNSGPAVPKLCVADALFRGIRDQFPGDPWIHLCNGCSKVHVFFLINVLLN